MIDRPTLWIALRTLGRNRGFTIVAVLSIGVAIALNTTMYSVLDAMLAPQVNARRPDQIFSIHYFGDRFQRLGPDDIATAVRSRYPGLHALSGARPYAQRGRAQPLAENGSRYMRLHPEIVWPNYFDFLGAVAQQGRTFLPRDVGERGAVISDRAARKLYPDESPVGRAVLLDGEPFVIIGVVARSSTFLPLSADMWILARSGERQPGVSLMRFTEAIDPRNVGDELKDVAAQLALAAGEQPGETGFRGRAFATRHYVLRGLHYALIGAVLAVLLIACANLANLQLARGLARSRELALRSAIGASRRQIVQHLTLETGLLAAFGLLAGTLLTLWGIHVVRSLIPPAVEDYIIEPQTSWRMFAFAGAVALVCLFLVGLLPALHISRVDPDTLLKAGQGTGRNRAHRRRYGVMVIAQIGLSLPVLIGAVVVAKAALRLHSRDWLVREVYGYDPTPVVAANVPIVAPPGRELRVAYADLAAELTAQARSVPGVLDAAAYFLRDPDGRNTIIVDDETGSVREAMAHLWSYRVVSPSYFRTMGRQIERGRDFLDAEFDGQALIVDGPTARYLWGRQEPIGRAVRLGDRESLAPFRRVVGVVGDLRDTFAIRRRDPTANFRLNQVYRVIAPGDTLVLTPPRPPTGSRQSFVSTFATQTSVTIYARTRGNSELAAIRIQRALRSRRSGSQSPTAVPMLDQFGISEARVRQDFVASLFSVFAALGVALAALGVYGIVSHSVAERRRELAVRISLGAQLRDILRSVLREGNAVILAGIALGLAFTYYSIGWLGMFFTGEFDGNDSVLFALISAVLFAVAALAAFIPAMRAWSIDPVDALRHE